MVVGSFSANFYGVPRATEEADFVIEFSQSLLASLRSALGAAFRIDPQLLLESATGTTRNIVHLVGSQFHIELFRLSSDPHDQERFRRRVAANILGCPAYLPTPEDVIVTKLRWFDRLARPKDRDDVQNVLAVQKDRLDWEYVNRWCDEHQTRHLLDQIRASIPPI